jgi:hypothetical protein
MGDLQATIVQFLTGGAAGWLVPIGTAIFAISASIRLTLWGRKMITTGGDMFGHLLFEELLPIAAGVAVLSYWASSSPIPGVGRSIPEEFINAVSSIVSLVNKSSDVNVTVQIAQWQSQMEIPSIANVVGILIYAVITGLCWLMECVGFIAGAIPMVTTAVCIVVGPLALSTILSRNFDFIFRGWLRAFICYGTMPITVSIIAGIMSNFVVTVLTKIPVVSMDQYVGESVFIILVLATGFICTAISPVIHAHILSGSSGAGGGLVGSITGAVVGRISR